MSCLHVLIRQLLHTGLLHQFSVDALWLSFYRPYVNEKIVFQSVFMFATVEPKLMFTAEHICPFIGFSLCWVWPVWRGCEELPGFPELFTSRVGVAVMNLLMSCQGRIEGARGEEAVFLLFKQHNHAGSFHLAVQARLYICAIHIRLSILHI